MEIPKIQRVILFQKRPEGLPTEECFDGWRRALWAAQSG
jgi:hypothetical protein